MKTPENILYDRGITLIDCISSSMYNATVEAMESYAEQQAIEFIKWMERTNTINNSGVPPHILFKMYKNQTNEEQE